MCVDSYVRIYKQTLQNILMPHPAVIAGSHKIKSNILEPAVRPYCQGVNYKIIIVSFNPCPGITLGKH